jgi:hypothetical protein
MRARRRLFVAAALVLAFTARDASGEIWHLKSPSTLETEKGSRLSLPPGYFLDEETWREKDLEMRRLQEQETRLTAENESLRKAADFPPWAAVALGVAGAALGITFVLVK